MLAQPIVGNLSWVVLPSPRELITRGQHSDAPVLRDIPNRLIGINLTAAINSRKDAKNADKTMP